MTFQAPCHRKCFVLMNDFHFVDPSMTRHAANAVINVCRMSEEDKVGLVVNLQPRNWLAARITINDEFQILAVGFDARMAVHADFCIRNCRIGS